MIRSRKDFLVPFLLLLLSAIPMLGGAMRLKSLMPGAAVSAGDGRFLAAPFPILIHVVAAAWIINLLVAEWLLARRDQKSSRWVPVVKREISPG